MEIAGIIIGGRLLLIFSIIIFIIIRAILFIKNKKFILKNEILYMIFCVYIISLISVTLLPILIYFTPQNYAVEPSINLNIFDFISTYSNSNKLLFFKNTIGNLILLVPLGILLPLIWNKKFKSLKKVTIIGFSTSLIIEILQYFEIYFGVTRGYRVCDITDLIFNTISIMLGYMIFQILFDDEKFIISK